jgi:hypothetical protein
VTDGEGRPIQSVVVGFRDRYSIIGMMPVTSDSAGCFRLEGVHHEGEIQLRHPDYASEVVPMKDAVLGSARMASLKPRLERGTTITGVVRREDGFPAIGEIVSLKWSEGRTIYNLPWTVTQRDGSYRIDHVPSAELLLCALGESRTVVPTDGSTLVLDFGGPDVSQRDQPVSGT